MSNTKIIIDLDNTITRENPDTSYEDKEPNKRIINVLNNLEIEDITIFTARNMRSYKGDLEKINAITKPIAESWLEKNSVKYSEIIMGKPWCGEEGFYIDDKNLSLDEFEFRFGGPYKNHSVDIIIPFYNEEGNVEKTHENQSKLNNLFNIKTYIYVNNGSTDNTLACLNNLAKENKKIRVINLKENSGYGGGMKAGIKSSNADMVITNHADGQFDGYSFFLTHLDSILVKDNSFNILPKRVNRNTFERLNTRILNILISIIKRKKIDDFNGQPKLFAKDQVGDIDRYPNDFTFDFELYKKLDGNFKTFPIIQKERGHGVSSWSGDFFKRLKIFIGYLKAAIK